MKWLVSRFRAVTPKSCLALLENNEQIAVATAICRLPLTLQPHLLTVIDQLGLNFNFVLLFFVTRTTTGWTLFPIS